MNKTYQDYLFQSFPELFDDASDAPLKQWGIEVQDGWYPIIARMCCDMIALFRKGHIDLPRIHQIKSKFGQLTVYMSASDEAVEKIVGSAIESSQHTCEICGAPGILRCKRNRWYLVACPEHAGDAEPVGDIQDKSQKKD